MKIIFLIIFIFLIWKYRAKIMSLFSSEKSTADNSQHNHNQQIRNEKKAKQNSSETHISLDSPELKNKASLEERGAFAVYTGTLAQKDFFLNNNVKQEKILPIVSYICMMYAAVLYIKPGIFFRANVIPLFYATMSRVKNKKMINIDFGEIDTYNEFVHSKSINTLYDLVIDDLPKYEYEPAVACMERMEKTGVMDDLVAKVISLMSDDARANLADMANRYPDKYEEFFNNRHKELREKLLKEFNDDLDDIFNIYPENYDAFATYVNKDWLAIYNVSEKNQWHRLNEEQIIDLISYLIITLKNTSDKWLDTLSSIIDQSPDNIQETFYVITVPLVILGTRILTNMNPLPDCRAFMIDVLKFYDMVLKDEYQSLYRDNYEWEHHLDAIIELESEQKQQAQGNGNESAITMICSSIMMNWLGNLLDDPNCSKKKAYDNFDKLLEDFKIKMRTISRYFGLDERVS